MFLVGACVAEFRESLLPFFKRYWFVSLAITVVIMLSGIDCNLGNYGLFRTIALFACLLGFAYAAPR